MPGKMKNMTGRKRNPASSTCRVWRFTRMLERRTGPGARWSSQFRCPGISSMRAFSSSAL